MTSPLPTPSKSPTAEGARLDLGNFFQIPSARPGANSSKPDFESLLSQRQPKNQTEEAHEEREAAKARKKPIDIALSTPLAQETTAPRPETTEPSAATPQNPTAPEATSTLEATSNPEARSESEPAPKPAAGEAKETSEDQPEAESDPVEIEATPGGMQSSPVEMEAAPGGMQYLPVEMEAAPGGVQSSPVKMEALQIQMKFESGEMQSSQLEAEDVSVKMQYSQVEIETDPANLARGTVESSEAEDSAPVEYSTISKNPFEDMPASLEKTVKTRDEKEQPETDANGMEPAQQDPEMISLATFEGVESGSTALREPSITSSHRLTAFAATDRNGLAPVGGAGGSSESGLGHLAAGSGLPTEARQVSITSPAAQASALFKTLAPELEKFQQTSRSQMQLDIPVGENESVRIRLSIRAGELRSTFITESPELREALQKAWPEFAHNSRERGVRLGDPTFQQSFQGNDSAFGQNSRRNSGGADFEQGTSAGIPLARKSASRASSNQPSTALWA